MKSNFEPGRWRVTAATANGRAMAALTFTVEQDEAATDRTWTTLDG